MTRLRDWWDLRLHRYDRIFARLDALEGLGEPPTGAHVREPRRPRLPSLSGRIALELPDE
jgi:hypothetical protein